MRVLLIRHGQTPANVAGVLATSVPGPGLTELGREQAAALPGALEGEPIDGIYTSVLLRTQLTAEPLAADREQQRRVREGLHEIEAGALEGKRDRDSVMTYLETLYTWGQGDLGHAMPGGPDGHEFFGRFDDAIGRIAAEHDSDATIAVVSHGAAIRVWCGGRTLNVDPEFAARHELENTGVVTVTGSFADGWTVENWMGVPLGGRRLEDPTAVDPAGEAF